MNLPDAVYNWMQDFYSGRSHCTRYGGDISQPAAIHASVVQGSGLGPASFIVTTADLQPLHDGNRILKYADDIYLVVPEVNEHTCESELTHVYEWAATNNLTLNCAKSKELVFCARKVRGRCTQPPPPCRGIERVKSLSILDVVVNDRMTAVDHVSHDVFQAALCAAGPASARITSRITLRCRLSHSDFQIDLLLASLVRLVLRR